MSNDDWSPNLSPAAAASVPKKQFKTFWALAIYADVKTNRCYPSIDTLAELVGCDRSNIMRDLNVLIDGGFVKRVGFHGRARLYELTLRIDATGRELATGRDSATSQGSQLRDSKTATSRKFELDGSQLRDTNIPLTSQKKEKKEGSPFGHEYIKSVIGAYQTICKALPQMRNVETTAAGKTVIANIKARSKEYSLSEADWSKCFERVAESPFLRGENDRHWKADLQWIVNATNFAKIDQGKYDDHSKPDKPPHKPHSDLYVK